MHARFFPEGCFFPRVCSPPIRQSFLRAGFTLVELLIVIGVIVVLIALLLPSVASVRARARTAECQSNLTQLGLAIHAANRNRSTPVHSNSWVKDIEPLLEGENGELFICPDDLKGGRGLEEPSFAANNQMHRMGGSDGRKLVILDFEEGDEQDGIFNAAPNGSNNNWKNEEGNWQNALDAAGQRHGGDINVLRHDGSVSAESAQDLIDYHPENSPEDWVPWKSGDGWICPDADCGPPGVLATDLTPDVSAPPGEEDTSTGGESTGGDDAGGDDAGGEDTGEEDTDGEDTGGGTGETNPPEEDQVTACGDVVENGFVCGLYAEFWNNNPLDNDYESSPVASRVDNTLNFPPGIDGAGNDIVDAYNPGFFGSDYPPYRPDGVASNVWCAQWSGEIQAPATGSYQFYMKYDDGTQVMIDNVTIHDRLDHFYQCDTCSPVAIGQTFNWQAGEWYCIRIRHGVHC